jgi:hypothetical protein
MSEMDVAIKPFWIVLSVVYFSLAAKHYYRMFVITPSIYMAAAYTTPAPGDDPYRQTIFRKFIRDIEKDRQLMWLATVGFFVGGVVFLLQGITNVEYQIPVNVAVAIAVVVAVLVFVYWRWRWVFMPITGPVSRWWLRTQFKSQHERSPNER